MVFDTRFHKSYRTVQSALAHIERMKQRASDAPWQDMKFTIQPTPPHLPICGVFITVACSTPDAWEFANANLSCIGFQVHWHEG